MKLEYTVTRKKRWHVLQSIALFCNIGNWGEEPSFALIYDSNELD